MVASYVVADILFLGTGIMLISAAAVWQKATLAEPTMESVARLLLLKDAPLMGMVTAHSLLNDFRILVTNFFRFFSQL